MSTFALSLAPECLGFVFFDDERRLRVASLHDAGLKGQSSDVFAIAKKLAEPVIEMCNSFTDTVHVRWLKGRDLEAGVFLGLLLAKKIKFIDYPIDSRGSVDELAVKKIFAEVEWANVQTPPQHERKRAVFFDALDLGVKVMNRARSPSTPQEALLREQIRAELRAELLAGKKESL